jgi:hypothetical protein
MYRRRYQYATTSFIPFFEPEQTLVSKWYQPIQEPQRQPRFVPGIYFPFVALNPLPIPPWFPGPRDGEFSGDLYPRAFYYSLSPGGQITDLEKPDAALNLGSDPQRSSVRS